MNTCSRLVKLTLIALPLLLVAGWSFSQTYFDSYSGAYGYPYFDNKAATVGESYARGLSDVIRSQGASNLMNSEAYINAQEGDKKSIENREQWTKTYFEMRRDNREDAAQTRTPPPTPEQMVRFAQMGAPKPLGANELDKISGKIHWPLALTTDQYAYYRKQLDTLFAKRAQYGDISMNELMDIVNLTKEMTEILKQQIKEIPAMEYSKAKAFLSSLAYEVQRTSG